MENVDILEAKINLLVVLFGHTFLETTRENYSIKFVNSNVVDDMEALEEFYSLLANSSPTTQNQRDLSHLTTLIETYTYLIAEYKKLNAIQYLPNNLKSSSLLEYLRKHIATSARVDTKKIINEVIKELSTSSNTGKKINKTDQIKADAAIKTAIDNLKLIQNQVKNGNKGTF